MGGGAGVQRRFKGDGRRSRVGSREGRPRKFRPGSLAVAWRGRREEGDDRWGRAVSGRTRDATGLCVWRGSGPGACGLGQRACAEWAVTLGLVREDAGARVWRDGLRVLGCGAGPRLGDAATETGRGAGLRGVAGLARVGPRGERVRGRRVGPVWVVCWVGFG